LSSRSWSRRLVPPSNPRSPAHAAGEVGQLLWWVNYLLKQSVPTHRLISFRVPSRSRVPSRVIRSRLRAAVHFLSAGDPRFPLVKKDPHHQQIHFSSPPGIQISSRRGSFPHQEPCRSRPWDEKTVGRNRSPVPVPCPVSHPDVRAVVPSSVPSRCPRPAPVR